MKINKMTIFISAFNIINKLEEKKNNSSKFNQV